MKGIPMKNLSKMKEMKTRLSNLLYVGEEWVLIFQWVKTGLINPKGMQELIEFVQSNHHKKLSDTLIKNDCDTISSDKLVNQMSILSEEDAEEYFNRFTFLDESICWDD